MIFPPEICIRILTHNIRYAKEPPLFKGEAPWSTRKSRIISELLFSSLYCLETLICLQEVLHSQVKDVLLGLNADAEEWAYVGVGRDDGRCAGEYSPIFYRRLVWKIERFETIWLSLTPGKPSRSWDAACKRILSIAKMRHLPSGREICVMNTHLDDQGSISRLESAKIIHKEIESRTKLEEDMPLLLAGDFNCETHQDAYRYLTRDAGLLDIREQTSNSRCYGHQDTFSGFEKAGSSRIDFLFMNQGIKQLERLVRSYAVLENRFEGVYCSDHRAVISDIVLR